MTGLLTRSRLEAFRPVIRKLRTLGSVDPELEAVLSSIKTVKGASRGADIVAAGSAPRHTTVLLDGVACLYERLKDGNRQIYAFQYSGDFCDLHRQVVPDSNDKVAVAAMTGC